MPLISVVTPVHPGRRDLLAETAASVAAQVLPAGWDLEWLVQEDGGRTDLTEAVSTYPFAAYESHRAQLGPAASRNLALSRARGDFLHVLDSDDLLLPHALATAIAAFSEYPAIHWVIGQADDLLPDGSRKAFPPPIEPGFIPRSSISEFVLAGEQLPVQTAGLTARTESVRALGGWAAHPISEDTLMFVALAELTDGYFTPEVTWLYRKHEGQITQGVDWRHERWRTGIVEAQRVTAIRASGLCLVSSPRYLNGPSW